MEDSSVFSASSFRPDSSENVTDSNTIESLQEESKMPQVTLEKIGEQKQEAKALKQEKSEESKSEIGGLAPSADTNDTCMTKSKTKAIDEPLKTMESNPSNEGTPRDSHLSAKKRG